MNHPPTQDEWDFCQRVLKISSKNTKLWKQESMLKLQHEKSTLFFDFDRA
ncbi:hypothetical protein HBZC1_17070 [Helicobacter bizzozeronii CIII-1]|uniref:Uncharacterized protein n=1 Tax=Helicobacter bizzozeronii (strain CIII-1) TaxID=1002804 RepID=F8KPG9_HELBC|nr:hypothetical protein HBZC1_17070 [Helicobacter bizzozeronii CIII-1]